jgi:hypothetical protein
MGSGVLLKFRKKKTREPELLHTRTLKSADGGLHET